MPHHGDFPVIRADGRLLPGKADLDLRDHIRRGRAVQPRHTAARNDRHKQHDQQQPFADAFGDAVQNLHGGRSGFILRLVGRFLRQRLRRGGHRGSLRLFALFGFLHDLLDGDLQRAGHIGGALFLQCRLIGRGLRCSSGDLGRCIDLGRDSHIERRLGSVCGFFFSGRSPFPRRSGGFLRRCPVGFLRCCSGRFFRRCPGRFLCRCSGGLFFCCFGSFFRSCPGSFLCRCFGGFFRGCPGRFLCGCGAGLFFRRGAGFGFARTGGLFLGGSGLFGCRVRRRFGCRRCGLRRDFRRRVCRGCRLFGGLPGQFFLVIHILSSPKFPAGNSFILTELQTSASGHGRFGVHGFAADAQLVVHAQGVGSA